MSSRMSAFHPKRAFLTLCYVPHGRSNSDVWRLVMVWGASGSSIPSRRSDQSSIDQCGQARWKKLNAVRKAAWVVPPRRATRSVNLGKRDEVPTVDRAVLQFDIRDQHHLMAGASLMLEDVLDEVPGTDDRRLAAQFLLEFSPYRLFSRFPELDPASQWPNAGGAPFAVRHLEGEQFRAAPDQAEHLARDKRSRSPNARASPTASEYG